MVWKRTKELFVLSEIYNIKAIVKSLYCWDFEDDGCLPRDLFIPKQESDNRKQLIQQVSYKNSSTTLEEIYQIVLPRGFWRQTVALWSSNSTSQRRTAVLSNCYLFIETTIPVQFQKVAIIEKMRKIESSHQSMNPTPSTHPHAQTISHAPQYSNSNFLLAISNLAAFILALWLTEVTGRLKMRALHDAWSAKPPSLI